MADEIKFKDLSFWLKVGTVGGIIAAVYMALAFTVGFIIGLIGV